MIRRRLPNLDPVIATTIALVAAAVIALVFAVGAGAASGGIGTKVPGGKKPGKAKLLGNGKAVAPANAPKRIVKAIAAGNKIRHKPYRWGGGHANFKSKGYDCSGAVSYVLHGAGMLSNPLNSSGLTKWGRRGGGKWITVYAHGGHTYVIVAGLRFDTSGSGGKGPRWRAEKRSSSGYKVRHFNKSY